MAKKRLTAGEKMRAAQERARQLAFGTLQRKQYSEEETLENSKAQRMADLYEKGLQLYESKKTLKYVNLVKRDHKSFGYFLKAATFADELGVEYPLYMDAQFYFIHKWKGRAPKCYELASYKCAMNSRDRVGMYMELAVKEKEQKPKSRVAHRGKAPQDMRFKNCDIVLQRFMKLHKLSEEEVFSRFKPAIAYFDKDWLKQNAVYQSLKRDNKI